MLFHNQIMISYHTKPTRCHSHNFDSANYLMRNGNIWRADFPPDIAVRSNRFDYWQTNRKMFAHFVAIRVRPKIQRRLTQPACDRALALAAIYIPDCKRRPWHHESSSPDAVGWCDCAYQSDGIMSCSLALMKFRQQILRFTCALVRVLMHIYARFNIERSAAAPSTVIARQDAHIPPGVFLACVRPLRVP